LNLVYRNNATFLGSDQNWQSITLDYRKYIPFPMDSKNILAFWSFNIFTIKGKQPYLDLPSTASDTYNNTGRGYIQGRFRGDKFVFAESEYRFGITENGLIGGVVFANMESVSTMQGKPLQSILPGYGAGIRIKLSKHSNTNIAIDYGIGQGGSKGIFMNLGEVF
jgi:outer membrane protein assembly factor BamA